MDKAAMRAMMRQSGPVPPEEGDRIVAGLFTWLSARLPGTISSFIAMSGEVDLSALMTRLPGWRWVLPRVETDRSMTFRDAAVPRETHPFGMEQPTATGPEIPIHEIDVMLVPGLAFDATGRRLGNGAGHYDRALSGARGDVVSIGICAGKSLVPEVPTETHDLRVRYLATSSGVVDVTHG